MHILPFTLIKIGSGFHPVIDIEVDGKSCKGLIDTGANITVKTMSAKGALMFLVNGVNYLLRSKYHKKYPGNEVLVIIGNDILIREKAVINYADNTITFNR